MDLVPSLLPKIQQNRLPGLNLGDDFICPSYAGQSILNLPASICQLLGAPAIGAAALDEDILSPLGAPVQRVIFILMDALALHRLQHWLADGSLPVWSSLLQQGLLAPLTSIVPSTTSAALTTLWTGHAPAGHGILGYEMWLKEYGMVANTIKHSPSTFEGDSGSLAKAGFSPETFLPLPTMGGHLQVHGIKTRAYQHINIARSGLSQMLLRDVEIHTFTTPTDLWVNLRRSIEQHPHEKTYFYVYWDMVDTFSHRYGPDDERPPAEFASFSTAFERSFLARLSPALSRNTLVILTADHGQIATHPDPHYELKNHPSLSRRLHIQPTGENRLAFLFVRPGQIAAVREYVERTWPNQFLVLDAPYVAEAGLFGPDQHHPRLPDRLGELLLAARGNAYLWWAGKENRLLGRHGGLHPEEMLVPFLAARL